VPAYGNHVRFEVSGDDRHLPDGLRRVQQGLSTHRLGQHEQRFDIENPARHVRCVWQDHKADGTIEGGSERGRVDLPGGIQADDVELNPLGLLQAVQWHQNRNVIGAARNGTHPPQPSRAMDGKVERMRSASGEDDSFRVRHIEHPREPLSTLPCYARVVRDAAYSHSWGRHEG
jgi:hypothetical protein